MKKTWITLLAFSFLTALVAPAALSASTEVDAKTARKEVVKKTALNLKSLQKDLNFTARVKKKMSADTPIDFQTEPDRWMWFWIFSWGIAAILSIIFYSSAFWLPSLFWLAGTVFLIIWLVQKFS
ncbi:MAG: hypothetical protein SFV52_05535 [Saprospiraceae bacterium]|nr:hypothetical protein [Saprospiraceae bacterium]